MRYKVTFALAAALAVASVVMGAVVCATESGAACPTWPGCYPDRFVPQVELNPLIEFTHRVIAGATGPAVLVAAILARKLDRLPRRLAWIGLAGTLAAGAFGMLIVLIGIPWWLGVLDVASALVATVSLILARLLLDRRWRPQPGARAAWVATGTIAVMYLAGLAVAGPNSFTRCLSWPLGILQADRWPLVQGLRLVLALAAVVLIGFAVRHGLAQPSARLAAGLTAGLLLAELVLAGALGGGAAGVAIRTGYAVIAALLFAALALLAGQLSSARPEPPDEVDAPLAAGITAE